MRCGADRLARLAALALALLLPLAPARAAFDDWVETPSLAPAVAEGRLPPIAQRLPAEPRVVDLPALGREPGRHGGTLRMLMGGQKDIRMMTIYGYARLIGFNEKLEIVPDILEAFDVQEGRIFTFRLRRGHKWSDGHPFTTEDIRYAWEDVIGNSELTPGGLPAEVLAGGEPPKFEVLDERTVRFTWARPNPDFLPALAGARPLYVYLPAHYLKQFHRKYQDPKTLAALAKRERARDWVALHERMARQYRPENPELPTLEPWRNTTKPPSPQFVFERNPFYHRVDNAGRQLPYVDRVVINIGSNSLIPAKTGAGDSDLQARYISFDDYTFLRDAANRRDIRVRLWERGEGARIALYPNLNYEDPVWRDVLRDVRFRRALSLAVDRREINQAIYFGLAHPSANTVLPESPLYRPDYPEAWARFDPALANRLLDEMGLKLGEDGFRHLADGRLMEVIVESSGESTEETDVLQLIGDHWRSIGVKLFVRASQRTLFRNRIFAGKAMMSVWTGIQNAIPTAELSPWELAPTTQQQLQWPQWGQHYETHGQSGHAPDLAPAQKLLDLYLAWRRAATSEERRDIWHEMLALYTDNVFSIGTVNGALQPVVVAKALRNVPEKALYNFDPGAFFGIYLPDTFWWANP